MHTKARKSLGSRPSSSAPSTAIDSVETVSRNQEPLMPAPRPGFGPRRTSAINVGVDAARPRGPGRATTGTQAKVHQPWMTRRGAAEHVGCGDDGEEREPLGVAGEVGDEQAPVADEAETHAAPTSTTYAAAAISVQDVGEPADLLLVGGDGDDAGCHHEREVAGEQRRDRADAAASGSASYGRRHGRR